MKRVLIVGNSGSGKSTLARQMAEQGSAHLDLDTLAWEPQPPPVRRPLEVSSAAINAFLGANERWVIEGCYADLLAVALPSCTRLIFLNPGVEACVANARLRPWEPHKYASKEAQDANLEMLIGWIRDYGHRTDECSLRAHRLLFDGFSGDKQEVEGVAPRPRPPHPRAMAESMEDFRARSLASGADEVLERCWSPGQIVPEHAHPFDAQALVTEGEMWLTSGGETRHLRAGDTFHISEGVKHSERYGPLGATYWVARRKAR